MKHFGEFGRHLWQARSIACLGARDRSWRRPARQSVRRPRPPLEDEWGAHEAPSPRATGPRTMFRSPAGACVRQRTFRNSTGGGRMGEPSSFPRPISTPGKSSMRGLARDGPESASWSPHLFLSTAPGDNPEESALGTGLWALGALGSGLLWALATSLRSIGRSSRVQYAAMHLRIRDVLGAACLAGVLIGLVVLFVVGNIPK